MRSILSLSSRRQALVIGLYTLLALALTYPLVLHLATHGPGRGVDDPAQTWSLWWVRFALFDLGGSPLATDYLFFPLGLNLVAYTPVFLNGVVSIPLQFAGSVVLAQNILVYFSLIASGYGAFLLAREILAQNGIDSDLAAMLAGAFYAFGAWHLQYVAAGHFMLLSNQWIPFYTLFLVRLNRAHWKAGVCAGVFFALAAWTELTFAPFLAILTVLYLFYLALTQPRTLERQSLAGFAWLGGIAGLALSPLAISLLNDIWRYGYYLTSGAGRFYIFSAEPISFFVPSPLHPFLGEWAQSITQANTSYAFIGYAVLLLAAVGFSSPHAQRDVRVWGILAGVFGSLMLGPVLIVNEQSTGIPLPFAGLSALPFVNANRYPVRFNVMLMLALVPLIALGVARLRQARRSTIILGALIPLLVFEQLVMPIPISDMRVPQVFQTIRDDPGDFALLEIPLGWRGSIVMQGKQDDRAQFFQTVHRKRLLGGITSRFPDFSLQYFLQAPVINTLIALEIERHVDEVRLEQDRAIAQDVLRFFNIRYVDMNRALTNDGVMNYVRDIFPLVEFYRDNERSVYRVEPLPPLRAINADDETARLYFDDRWGRVQFADGVAYRWSTRDESLIWLPLEQRDQTITMQMRGARNGQAVSVRVNGHAIVTLTLSDAWTDYAVNIPASVVRDGLSKIDFSTTATPVGASRLDDYTIGETGVVSPVDIAATGAGFEAGRFGSIWVAGQNIIPNRRGYHLVAVNSNRVGSFDTFADPGESPRLAQFIADLPPGEIVVGAAIDDVSKNLLPSAIAALRSIGVESDLRFQFRAGHAFIGVKGAQPGQALEQIDGRFPANVSVGKNVASERAGFALGEIKIDQ